MNSSQHTAQADNPVAHKKRGLFRRLGVSGTVFLLGLCIGLAFFLSRELLWGQVLRATLGHLPHSSWTWQSVGERGLSHISYNGFDLMLNRIRVSLRELGIQLSTKPPVTMRAVTGPLLQADLSWGKTLRFSGGVDLRELLPEQRLQGVVEGVGQVQWEDLDRPPVGGEVELSAPGLVMFAPGVMATGLNLQAYLEGNLLTLASIRADGPIALEAEGTVTLDWQHLENSTYTLTGTLIGLGGMPFSASGRLGGLWGK